MGKHNWVIGVAIKAIGSVGANLGTNLLKLAYVQSAKNQQRRTRCIDNPEKLHKTVQLEFRTKLIRIIGSFIFVASSVISFLAFGYAAQSLLSALEPGFITNVIFGRVIFKQPVTKRVVLSTGLILIGNIIIVIFSSHSSQNFTAAGLVVLYTNPDYIVYMVALTVISVSSFSFHRYLTATAAGSSLEIKYPFLKRIGSLLFVLYSSMIGTQTIVFAKCLSNVLRATLSGKNQLGHWYTYAALMGWFCFMVFWLKQLNRSLKLFSGNAIIPIMQCGWIIFGVISGAIFFQEFIHANSLQYVMFTVGLCTLVLGVVQLAPNSDAEDVMSSLSVSLKKEQCDEKALVNDAEPKMFEIDSGDEELNDGDNAETDDGGVASPSTEVEFTIRSKLTRLGSIDNDEDGEITDQPPSTRNLMGMDSTSPSDQEN
jgi:hypothetical protein